MADPATRRTRGLGRGLSSLLGDPVAAPADTSGLLEIPLDRIQANRDQPRRTIHEEALAALADSIARHGLMQPLVVRALGDDRYELIAGERRWRAAARAGLDTAPAVVRETGERDRLELALVENMVREDLSPMEVARAVATLIEDFGRTHAEVGEQLGRSRPAISNLLRLLELPDDVQALVEDGRLSEGHARAVLMADGARARRLVAERAATGGLSVRETERLARAHGDRPTERPARAASPSADAAVDALTALFDVPVRVRPDGRGGVRVELRFPDEEALRAALGRLTG